MSVHILEGHSRGKKLTACGRLVSNDFRDLVGRAHIIQGERKDEITCIRCRVRYANYLRRDVSRAEPDGR